MGEPRTRTRRVAATGTVRIATSDLLSALPGQVAVIDGDGLIVAVNESWTRAAVQRGARLRDTDVGADYLAACTRAARRGDVDAARVLAGIRSVLDGHADCFVMDYRCGLENDQWYEMTVRPLREAGGAVLSHVNISKRHLAEIETRRLLDELSHVERVTLLGQLAASLAHELRQPLTAIAGNADAGRLMLDSPLEANASELQEIFDDIAAAGVNAGETIHRMSALLRKGAPQLRPFDLNPVIAEVRGLLQSSALMAKVTVTLDLEPDLPRVIGDRVQIQQVLLNLMHNAEEAMQRADSAQRELTVSARCLRPGEVEVCVRDTGPGIAGPDIERVFDAFFTTKTEGMGMGLHISRSIVLAHGGRLWANESGSEGATFCFTLPAHVG